MTNLEIVTTVAVANGLYTEEELVEFYDEMDMMPLQTYQEWKRSGYQVKKGEKAMIQTKLWKKNPKYQPSTEETEETEDEEQKKQRAFYLTKAFLFNFNQVEAIKKGGV